MRLANHSSFVLTVRVGGRAYTLDPLTADRFQTDGAPGLNYDAQATISPAVSGTLLCTIADGGGRIPGVYPLHLR